MVAGNWSVALFLSVLLIHFMVTTSDDKELPAGTSDVDLLLEFKSSITDPSGSLGSWSNQSAGPCLSKWEGITCDGSGNVHGLALESLNLLGRLNVDPLTALPFRTLSFANNSFTGTMPDLKKFKGLKFAYLSKNKLTGEIPDDAFDGMRSLKKVFLSSNGFTGRIPSSLVGVDPLLEVWMDNNGFVGEIPNFEQSGLTAVNVSNNNLEGKIPDRLSKMDPSMFAGNKGLCDPPTEVQCSCKPHHRCDHHHHQHRRHPKNSPLY